MNILILQEAIGNVNASGNLDKLEGGLDALMQATVCKVRGKYGMVSAIYSYAPFWQKFTFFVKI